MNSEGYGKIGGHKDSVDYHTLSRASVPADFVGRGSISLLLAKRIGDEGRQHAAVQQLSRPLTAELQWDDHSENLEAQCEHVPCCSS